MLKVTFFWRYFKCLLIVWALVFSQFALAASDTEHPAIFVQGNTLFYDGKIGHEGVDAMIAILARSPNINRIELNSVGGGLNATMDMVRFMKTRKVDTHVKEECDSGCIPIFLSGARRSLNAYARIVAHWGKLKSCDLGEEDDDGRCARLTLAYLKGQGRSTGYYDWVMSQPEKIRNTLLYDMHDFFIDPRTLKELKLVDAIE